MTNSVPADVLEQRAAEQRRRLHNSVLELRHSVRETLDVQKAVRPRVWQISAAAGFVALLFGYGITGAFTD